MVTQSRAFGTHLLALAKRRGILSGVWISTGNEADIQVADGISFLADDPETEAIRLHMQAIKDRDRFVEAVARARADGKPVIAMKVGGSKVGAAAAASHIASLAGSDAIYDAVFRQLGVERAVSPEDLIEIAYACTRGRLPRSRGPDSSRETKTVEQLTSTPIRRNADASVSAIRTHTTNTGGKWGPGKL
jgi:acetate---CoA ligase (ADP-forming)